jgi:DNA-binding NarL/FixJ family response regulator
MEPRPPVYRKPSTTLTRRENEVLELLVNEGMGNKEVGAALGIGEETVKRHLTMILNKTGFSTRLELVVRTWQARTAKPEV